MDDPSPHHSPSPIDIFLSTKPSPPPSRSSPLSPPSSPRWQLLAIYLSAGLLRVFLFLYTPSFPQLLMDRLELSTPLTSFRRLREGVFLSSHGLDPYEGGLFNHSPLHLLLSRAILPPSSPLTVALGYTLADLLSASLLKRIWDARKNGGESREVIRPDAGKAGEAEGGKPGKDWGVMVVFFFLFSPYTILTSLSRSTTTLDNLLVISSIHFAVMHKPMPALFLLALSTLTSLYPILLLPFLIAIFLETPTQSQRTPSISIIPPSPTESTSLNRPSFPPLTTASISSKPKAGPQIIKLLLNFTFSISILTLGFYLLNDRSWTGILKGPRVILGITDLTPNVGLSWYFFTEMFDHFRPFFTFVFQMHIVAYIFPFLLSFPSDPLFALTCFQLVVTLLKTYPTLGDSSLSLGLLGLFPKTLSHFQSPLIPTLWTLYALILLPLLSHLWLTAASGNANFFYAAGLQYGLSGALIGIGVVWAGKKRAFLEEVEEVEADGCKEGEGVGKKRQGVWEVLQIST